MYLVERQKMAILDCYCGLFWALFALEKSNLLTNLVRPPGVAITQPS